MKRVFFAITLAGALCGAGFLIASSQIECDSLYLSLYGGQSCAIQYVSRRCNVTLEHCYGVLPWTMQIDVYSGTCKQGCTQNTATLKNVGIWMVSIFGIMALVSGSAWMIRPTTIVVPVLDMQDVRNSLQTIQPGPSLEPASPSGDCPICFEETGHSWVCIVGCSCKDRSPPMHSLCLSRWAQSSPTCPFCRGVL